MTVTEVAPEKTTVPRRSSEQFAGLIGRQTPEWRLSSPGVDDIHGSRCIELFEWAAGGTRMYPWQVDETMGINAIDAEGRWVHKSAAIICPRQNGKSFIAEAIILYRLFVLGQSIVFTAQRWPTAKSIRDRLWGRIKSNRKLTSRIVRNVKSQGSAEIELDNGAKVQFSTRSGDSGRGFDKIDLVIFDEAYNLDAAEIDALLPIQLKADDSQTIYLSTPVNAETQTFGVKLSELRRKARKDSPPRTWWSEYAAPPDADRALLETWTMANPSLRSGYEVEAIEKLFGEMSESSFDVELLGRGIWYNDDADTTTVIDLDHWASLVDPHAEPAGESCIAVECEPARSDTGRVWSIAAAIDTPTGAHLQLGFHETSTPAKVAKKIRDLVDRNDPVAVVIDAKSVARDLLFDHLVKQGVEPELVTAGLVSKTTNGFLQAVDEKSITHDGDPRVRAALETASLREIGDAGGAAWSRKGGGQVAQLIALSYALWGLAEFRPVPKPKQQRTELRVVAAAPASVDSTSWQDMSF